MKKLLPFFVIAFLFLTFSSDVSAQTKVRVKFVKGTTSATLKGIVAGYKYIDYIIGAKSGQTMSVILKSSNAACNFVMFYSDMKNVQDADEVTEIKRNVDVDDNYIVRVLLPRSSARRKESASFSLKISIE